MRGAHSNSLFVCDLSIISARSSGPTGSLTEKKSAADVGAKTGLIRERGSKIDCRRTRSTERSVNWESAKMHLIRFIILICLYSLLTCTIVGETIPKTCTTPNNQTGVCINVRDCPHVIDLFERRALSQAVIKFLRQSQCDLRDKDIKICCANITRSKNKLLLDAEACKPMLNTRILGGQVAELNEFPWMALIAYKKPFDQHGFHCGGSLISSRYILTAAHCVARVPKEWEVESVRLGEWNLETSPDCTPRGINRTFCAPPHLDVAIESITIHPKYDTASKNQFNDIALLRTVTAVPFSEFIHPVCLPTGDLWRHNPFTNMSAEVAGWGQTENSSYSQIKLKTRLKIWDITQCEEQFQSLDINIKGTYHMCAGGDTGFDACRGDSGGPLVVTTQTEERSYYFQTGIVSFGVNVCGSEGWPGVYTRVGQYIDWIQQNIY